MTVSAYEAFDLSIKSELPLPGLRPYSGLKSDADVHIRYGDVPDTLPGYTAKGAAWFAAPGRLLLNIRGIASYLILNGTEIIISRDKQGKDDDIRTFLLGSSIGALLHQRNILPLHASAIRTKQGAVLFMGKSGAGKSTLLAAMLQRGYEMITDDITGIIFNERGQPLALPAFPRKRLAADTVAKLNFKEHELTYGRGFPDKYLVPAQRFSDKPQLVSGAYHLMLHNQPDIVRRRTNSNFERFEILSLHTYRKKFMYGLGGHKSLFESLTSATGTIPVSQISSPVTPFLLRELADLIEEDIR